VVEVIAGFLPGGDLSATALHNHTGEDESLIPNAGLVSGALIPTADQKAALIGTSAPSTANPFLNQGIGPNSSIREVNGNFWLTVNAYYDGTNWQRVDESRFAFAMIAFAQDNFPFEGEQGFSIWTCQPGTNPISSEWAAAGGWELGWDITAYRDMVIGGGGLEADGHGTFPYGRFVHAEHFGAHWTGILTNWFLDFSAKDDAAQPGWFIGRVGDNFHVRRTAADDGNWEDLLTLYGAGGGVANNLRTVNPATSLPYAVELTVDLDTLGAADVVQVTLDGDVSVDFTGGHDGQSVTLRLVQDGVGGRVVTWGASVRFSADLPAPTLSTEIGKTDYVGFRYNSAAGAYDCLAVNKGF
jgi:hypothetical protein